MDKRERVAAVLWRTQAEGTGTPQSVIDRRTPEAFAEESPQTREKWLKYAQAAIAALEPVTVQEERERIASIVETWRNDVPMTGKECAAAIRALAEKE